MSAITCKLSISSDASNSSSNAEKVHMRQFISAVQDYNKTKSDELASMLSRKLQLLGVSLDVNTFDPSSSVVAEFFVSLHELMSGLDSRSALVWFGIAVLQQACRNQLAHKALIHTYQFLPILSRLLGDYLTRDKKRKLLTLMQELTYGIHVSWQISYLPHLLSTLTKWIESGDDIITSLSLGVLLNLCYKNLPVIYTLMRTVNTKHFFRTISGIKSPSTEVQICKLLIVLENVNGQVPKDDILNFVGVTFRTIVEAFQKKDLIRLRHMVEFFLELRGQTYRNEAVAEYTNYHADVFRVLDAVETNLLNKEDYKYSMDLECMALLFEFLRSLVELNIPELQVLYPRIVNLTLGWVQTEIVCTKALSLLTSIVVHHPHKSDEVLQPLASGLSVLLHIIDSENMEYLTHGLTDQTEKLGALFQLIRAVVRSDSLKKKVLATLKQSSVLGVFDSLLGNNNKVNNVTEDSKQLNLTTMSQQQPRTDEPFTHTLNEDMYMHALALISELALHNDQWQSTFQLLIKQRQIQALIARAFYKDSPDMKILVLEMTRIPDFPMRDVTQTMCEIQPTVVQLSASVASSSVHSSSFHPNTVVTAPSQYQYYNRASIVSVDTICGGPPIMSGPQTEQLDQIIGQLKDALSTNQIGSIATSEVMELYEYKMAAIGHAERAAQSSLEAANQHATHLQHRLAQMSTEVSRLHQLLYHAQQLNEETQKRLGKTEESTLALNERLTKEQVRNKELSQQLANRDQRVENQQNTIQILEARNKEEQQNHSYLTKKYEDQVNKNISIVKASAAMETETQRIKNALEEKLDMLAKRIQEIETLTLQVKELEEIRKQQETVIAARDKELAETHKELAERKRILETITKLTTKT